MNWWKRLFGAGPSEENGSGPADEMISCDQAVERLYEFLDEELDADWMVRVKAHFDICQRCMPRVDFERAFLRAVQKVDEPRATPEDVRRRILDALAEEGLEPR